MSGQHIESSLGDTSILEAAIIRDPATDAAARAFVVSSGNGDLLPMIFGGAV